MNTGLTTAAGNNMTSPNPSAKKSLGQHWLVDQAALQRICDAGAITADDTVLEIGPGTGTLTRELASRAKQVIAVELDDDLAKRLMSSSIPNVTVIHADILRFDFSGLPANYKVVANIPYYLTSHLLRILAETPNPAQRVVLLVQKEVAERVVAKPGALSILAVTSQYYWDASLGDIVPAALFSPPPKVDSQVLCLQKRPNPLWPDVEPKFFFQLVKAGFANRRKTLLNSLSSSLRAGKAETEGLLRQAGIDPLSRPQTLSLTDWYHLYQVYRPG